MMFQRLKNLRNCSSASVNLVGRNYLKPIDFDANETKSVLWTAMELKEALRNKSHEVNHIKAARITLLMHKPCIQIQASAKSAADLLKSNLNIVIDPEWDTTDFVNDTGIFFSTCSEMIFCQSQYQTKIEKLAEGSKIPVVAVRSCTYTIIEALADILTLQEKYGHLKNLNVGWIGKPSPLINTYLCIAPRLGVNIHYHCACPAGTGMSPAALPLGKINSTRNQTTLQECATTNTAIDRAHCIVVSKHDVPEYILKLEHIYGKADDHWSLIYTLPRGTAEIDKEVLSHKNTIVWQAKGNLQWIYAALMLRLLSEYQHVTDIPDFDKDINCCPKPREDLFYF